VREILHIALIAAVTIIIVNHVSFISGITGTGA
jgi:hypothetical protein